MYLCSSTACVTRTHFFSCSFLVPVLSTIHELGDLQFGKAIGFGFRLPRSRTVPLWMLPRTGAKFQNQKAPLTNIINAQSLHLTGRSMLGQREQLSNRWTLRNVGWNLSKQGWPPLWLLHVCDFLFLFDD